MLFYRLFQAVFQAGHPLIPIELAMDHKSTVVIHEQAKLGQFLFVRIQRIRKMQRVLEIALPQLHRCFGLKTAKAILPDLFLRHPLPGQALPAEVSRQCTRMHRASLDAVFLVKQVQDRFHA